MTIADCQSSQYICYVLADETLGVLGWIGFFLGIAGFWVTIYQLFKLKSSAEHVNSAVAKLSTHVDSVNLAYLSAQMNTISHLVQNGDYHLAQITFTPIKRNLRLHANSRQISADGLDGLNRMIGKIDKQIGYGKNGDQKFSQSTANRLIDDLLSELTVWESAVSDKSRKEIQIENA